MIVYLLEELAVMAFGGSQSDIPVFGYELH